MRHLQRLFLISIALASFAVQAAEPTPLPGSVEPGAIERSLESSPTPQSQPGRTEDQPIQSEVVAPEGSENIEFHLQRIILDGATHYPEETLLAPYQSCMGTTVTVKQVYEVATAILNRYHTDGFAFVSVYVPPQEIDKGEVHIRVVEGHTTKIVTENIDDSPLIRQIRADFTAMRPLHMPTLEEQMLLLNDISSRKVKAVLEPDQESGVEGALILRLTAEEDKPVNASIRLDNYGSRYAGPWQAAPQLQLNGIVGNYDKTIISMLSTFPYREVHYIGFQHVEPITLRTSANFSVSASRSAPSYTLTPLDLRSNGLNLLMGLRHQIMRSRSENLSFSATLGAHDFVTDILASKLHRDRIRVARISATYDLIDRLGGINLASMTISKGFRALGASPAGSPDLSRAEGRPDFSKLECTVSRLQPLGFDLGLYALATGQYANTPLLAFEEFGYGGSSMGRAYNPSEITGDRGVSASAELRYYGIPAIADIVTAQPYAFYDIGKVWNLDNGGEIISAASAGFGIRLLSDANATLNLSASWALTKPPNAPIQDNPGAPRIGISLSYQY